MIANDIAAWSKVFGECYLLKLKVPKLIPKTREHEVHQADIFQLASSTDADLAYYDPPQRPNREFLFLIEK